MKVIVLFLVFKKIQNYFSSAMNQPLSNLF